MEASIESGKASLITHSLTHSRHKLNPYFLSAVVSCCGVLCVVTQSAVSSALEQIQQVTQQSISHVAHTSHTMERDRERDRDRSGGGNKKRKRSSSNKAKTPRQRPKGSKSGGGGRTPRAPVTPIPFRQVPMSSGAVANPNAVADFAAAPQAVAGDAGADGFDGARQIKSAPLRSSWQLALAFGLAFPC